MQISENVSLSNYSTMGLGGNAKYLTTVTSISQLDEAVFWAKDKKQPSIMIGGGSNVFWQDEGFSGLVIVNEIKGFETKKEADGSYEVKIGAGENWDPVVERTCKMGLSGIEGLSLVPGSAGATPIQNVGAYGQEIADVFLSLRAYDNQLEKYVELKKEDCKFKYRDSRFKKEASRFFIVEITLKLKPGQMRPPFYPALETYFSEHHISDYSPMSVRQAVINIRRSKLPDPKEVKNCGSFFANPIISNEQLSDLLNIYPDIPYWEVGEGRAKVHAAWLMDKCGFKDFHDKESGMGTWPKQTLILVNENAKSTSDLLLFKKKVVDAVKEKFNIELTQEPIMLPYSI